MSTVALDALRHAVLAPSGHNTQPWRFAVREDIIDLYADRTQRLPVVDPDDRALVISCGAALLNLRVALRVAGCRDDAYELLPEAHDEDLLARVRILEGDAPSPDDEALFSAIACRRTTRAPYEAGGLAPEVVRRLEQEAVREGAWLHIVDGEREAVSALVAQGDRLQMSDKHFRRELAAWVHPNRSHAGRGMRGASFGVGDLQSFLGPFVIRTFDVGRRQSAKDRELVMRAPLLAVLGTEADGIRDWLLAGQAMERVLLRACAEGLTSSFMNQPVEVEALRPRLAAAIGRSGGAPQLVMRFGHGPEVPPTPRIACEELLIRR